MGKKLRAMELKTTGASQLVWEGEGTITNAPSRRLTTCRYANYRPERDIFQPIYNLLIEHIE